MEVKPGYKQTEVGMIPEDWEVKSANQLGAPVRGGSPRPAGDPRYFNGSYIPWLTVAALTNIPESQLVVSETATFLTEEGSLHSRTLTDGTLIIANSGATLGVAKILGIKCCANDGIAALLNLSKRVSPRYLAHFINTKTSYLRDIVATGNGQPNLNTELIGNFKIPLPPTKAEQEAIAEALSAADALIESLEQLVVKKRQLKQGAMQGLLTGKKRLPGFSGEWVSTTMASIGATYGGLSGKTKDDFGVGNAQYVTFLNVLENVSILCDQFDHVRVAQGEAQHSVRKGDLLFNGTSETPGDLAMGAVLVDEVDDLYLNSFCFGFRLRDPQEHDALFIAYFFRGGVGRSTMYALAQGATRYNMSKRQFLALELSLPAHKEQVAIAAILSEMGMEITTLEVKLAKTRQLKQGTMQELLTGRIRLV